VVDLFRRSSTGLMKWWLARTRSAP